MKKRYYYTCEYCGAHLDPGEKCNCRKAFPFLSARKGAYDRGEDMSKYPLPWEKKGAEA